MSKTLLPIPTAVITVAVLFLLGCDRAAKPAKPTDPNVTAAPTVETNHCVFGDGFYKEERNQSVAFRWVRQNASLRVTAAAAGRYDLTFRPITVFSSRENAIEISVNGEKIGQASAHACDFINPQSTKLPAILKAGDNEVTLRSDAAEIRLDTGDDRTPAFGLVLPIDAEKIP